MSPIARITSVAAAAILSLAIAPPPDDLDAFIQAQMAQRGINGLSLAIKNPGPRSHTIGATGG